tara:strand:+ start:112 stop:375 length:264 start_codon:yes stop_codon:yes gene_type:complete
LGVIPIVSRNRDFDSLAFGLDSCWFDGYEKFFIGGLDLSSKYGGCSSVAEHTVVVRATGVRFSPFAFNFNSGAFGTMSAGCRHRICE